jgi:hypothetical protein
LVTWGEFEQRAPELATAGARLLGGSPDEASWLGIGFIATVRSDGGPRLAPVSAIVTRGRLLVAAVPPKRRDLERDGRYVLHAFLGADDAEFSVRGRARGVTDPELAEAAREAVAGTGIFSDPASKEALFELEIQGADGAVWENVGKPGTRPVRRTWRI